MVRTADRVGKERILVVDDEPQIRATIARMLRDAGYRCEVVRGATEARRALAQTPYDVMLCDVRLPLESTVALLKEILVSAPEMAVVLVTGPQDVELADRAVEIGAYGYVMKPFTPADVITGVVGALRQREHLRKQSDQLRASSEEMVYRLSSAVEARDPEAAMHIAEMSARCYSIARALGMDTERAELIQTAAALHDVGKIGVPDRILLKPGPLTRGERTEMQKHPDVGHRILAGSGTELLQLSATIAWTHHERFDGTGYPRGLEGTEIPLEGRIAAVADVFDALTRNRVYRPRLSEAKALDILEQGRGTHFDPRVLDAFLGDGWPKRLSGRRSPKRQTSVGPDSQRAAAREQVA